MSKELTYQNFDNITSRIVSTPTHVDYAFYQCVTYFRSENADTSHGAESRESWDYFSDDLLYSSDATPEEEIRQISELNESENIVINVTDYDTGLVTTKL